MDCFRKVSKSPKVVFIVHPPLGLILSAFAFSAAGQSNGDFSFLRSDVLDLIPPSEQTSRGLDGLERFKCMNE